LALVASGYKSSDFTEVVQGDDKKVNILFDWCHENGRIIGKPQATSLFSLCSLFLAARHHQGINRASGRHDLREPNPSEHRTPYGIKDSATHEEVHDLREPYPKRCIYHLCRRSLQARQSIVQIPF
jgi:hypothetical protein